MKKLNKTQARQILGGGDKPPRCDSFVDTECCGRVYTCPGW